jgi:hypothetical protein
MKFSLPFRHPASVSISPSMHVTPAPTQARKDRKDRKGYKILSLEICLTENASQIYKINS